MCRSRLAVPFLCAVLPGVDSSTNSSTSSSSNYIPLCQEIHTVKASSGENRAAGEKVAAEQLALSWESDFKELFQSVPSLTTQLFQATFFESTVCNRSHYQELNQISVTSNAAVLAESLSRSHPSPTGLLDVLTRIRNLSYNSVLDFLLDLTQLRRRVAALCSPHEASTSSASSDQKASHPLPAQEKLSLSSKRRGRRSAVPADDSAVDASATTSAAPADATKSATSTNMEEDSNAHEELVHDVLDAFDTLVGVCINYLTIHKMELYVNQTAILEASSSGMSREYSAEAALATTGSSTGVQLPTGSSDFEVDLRSEVDEAEEDVVTVKSAKSLKSTKSAKSVKSAKKTATADLASSNGMSPVPAIIVPSNSKLSNENAEELHTTNLALRRLADCSRGDAKDAYQMHLTHFTYLWRLSCESRFIGNTPHSSSSSSSNSNNSSNNISGAGGGAVVPTGGHSQLFVGGRSLSGWAQFVAEGAREEEALKRRRSEQEAAANEQAARDQISEWLDDSVQIEEKVRDHINHLPVLVSKVSVNYLLLTYY